MKYSLQQLGMVLRPIKEADQGLIYDSMINSLHKGNPQNKCIRMGTFKAYVRELLDTHLGHFETVIVCAEGNPDIIHGWAMSDSGRLVYCYVPLLWRNKGVATAMLDCLQVESYAIWTFHFRNIALARNLPFIPDFIKPFTK